MLFNVIDFEGLSPVMVTLILNHANVKVMGNPPTLPDSCDYKAVVVDGLLSAEQVDNLVSCFPFTISRDSYRRCDFIIYSLDVSIV